MHASMFCPIKILMMPCDKWKKVEKIIWHFNLCSKTFLHMFKYSSGTQQMML